LSVDCIAANLNALAAHSTPARAPWPALHAPNPLLRRKPLLRHRPLQDITFIDDKTPPIARPSQGLNLFIRPDFLLNKFERLIMKKIALLSLILAAGAAFAAEPASFDPVYVAGTATRTAVQADFSLAAKNDTLPDTGEVGQFAVETKAAGATREVAAVRAEGRLASRAHKVIGEV
jgi:hypothetical protein